MAETLSLLIVLLLVHLVSQDLSIAGKRAGLDGERSGLFMEAVRIIKEMRENESERIQRGESDKPIRPRFAIWENVPGALSSNNGEDFRVVLEELIHIREKDFNVPRCNGKWSNAGVICGNDWSIAWRVLDAQYWGVPQRRKRIALVMDFDGRFAEQILFESKGLSRDSEQGIKAWKGIATRPTESTNGSSRESFTVKIRGGCDKDANGKSAGKGALVQTELSGTIGVSQDQTLF